MKIKICRVEASCVYHLKRNKMMKKSELYGSVQKALIDHFELTEELFKVSLERLLREDYCKELEKGGVFEYLP
jgi:hypothetical protein